MALPVLIMGRSGSGKTYSLKNFTADEIGVISVEKGRLPFKSDITVVKVPKYGASKEPPKDYATLNRGKYAWIENIITKSTAKSIAIDDSQYCLLMSCSTGHLKRVMTNSCRWRRTSAI